MAIPVRECKKCYREYIGYGREFCSKSCASRGRAISVRGLENLEDARIKKALFSKNPPVKNNKYDPRSHPEYKRWRIVVLQRDNYTCVKCGFVKNENSKNRLEVDHIKSFKFYPELRLDPKNGRTLCSECHKKTKTYGIKSNIKGRKTKKNPVKKLLSQDTLSASNSGLDIENS